MNPWKFIIALIIFFVFLAISSYPHLWWISVLLGVWFLIFQVVAISTWKHKVLLFKYTDYFYYSIIGVVVFVGSRHISNDIIDYIDSIIGKEAIEERLIAVVAEIPKAEERVRKASEAVKNISDDQWNQDAIDALRLKLEREPSKLEGGNYSYSQIEGPLLSEIESQKDLDNLKAEKQYLEKKIQLLGKKSTVFSSEESLVMDFLVIPVLFLAGVALKLGKTTASFD